MGTNVSTSILSRTALRRTALTVAGLTAASVFATATSAHAAAATSENRAAQAAAAASGETPDVTDEQIAFIKSELGPEAEAELAAALSSAPDDAPAPRALPIAAVAIAAAAWCARGAVASIPTSVLSDVADGKFSGKGTYAKNAIIGCLGGEIGGWAWKVLPGWVKNKAVAAVAAFIIKYVR
ncbi:hypothetical protein [Streptomyces sp. ODS28]|uniref:hypothetical protein n=1 Tax=Streptomyces sp. ODS28 TaxID=3136688 RepID=UPI0031EBF171